MTKKRFQKRYVEKNNKVFDTWKNIPISRELNRYSLSHIISHLNGLGEIIDTKIEQGRYCMMKYKELEDENEDLKAEVYILQDDILNKRVRNLREENEQLKSENHRLQEEVNRLSKLTFELQDETEWLRNNTVWGQMPSSIRTSFSTTTVENPYCDKRRIKKR